jgi:hypothetical protein
MSSTVLLSRQGAKLWVPAASALRSFSRVRMRCPVGQRLREAVALVAGFDDPAGTC